jgi:hypothetical protein
VATRQQHEAVYRANRGMVECWRASYDNLSEELEWASRNMDAIEYRNAEIAVS